MGKVKIDQNRSKGSPRFLGKTRNFLLFQTRKRQRGKMEQWIPLLDIFLNNPTPETEASLWLQQSFNSSLSTSTTATAPLTTTSFISLLTKSCNRNVHHTTPSSSSSSSSPPLPSTTNRLILIQTLPSMVQSRILSFLAFERKRFCSKDLASLAREILSGNLELDFWVKKAARNLLDAMSERDYEWISSLNLDSEKDRVVEKFESMPDWLSSVADTSDLLLPWLPVSRDEINSSTLFSVTEDEEDSPNQIAESTGEDKKEVMHENKINSPTDVILEPRIVEMAASLRDRLLSFESHSETVVLTNEIQQFCLDRGGDSFEILGLIEPWKADDEVASVLISHLSIGNEEELGWPSQVLSSIVLPKFLVLEEPASRVIMIATIEYCKLHQKAAEYALLFPLILRRTGINNPICDVITRVLKECFHPAHVSAFCQKLLSGGKDERKFVCLPSHKHLISNELVWTESLFSLFQDILNQHVHLTKDSVYHLVHQSRELAERFSKSLKFGNFLLCLVTKCGPLLKSNKLLLTEAVECTNTLFTKSILSKLASL